MKAQELTAKELRIGNLVHTASDSMIINTEHMIMPDDLVHMTNGILKEKGIGVFGIPITEDWLLKFGFEKEKDIESGFEDGTYTLIPGRFTVYKFGKLTYNSIHGWWLSKSPFDGLGIKPPKYIHELQNLDFCLIGNELSITDTK